MNTNLRSKLIFGAAVIIVALVAFVAINSSGSAKKGETPYVGMGDLRYYESLQDAALKGTLFSDHPYIGMGDLRYFEALQDAVLDEGNLFGDHPYIGMGDLRYYESLQNKIDP